MINLTNMIGIVSYGYYLPRYRITVDEMASQNGKKASEIIKSLGHFEKTVAGTDEDSLTMGVEAALMALEKRTVKKKDIGAVFFGSETPSYAVKPTSTILSEFLGLDKKLFSYDIEFACKAGTSALITGFSLVKSKFTENVLICASDKATAKPGDVLEYTAASGAASFILGRKGVIAELINCGTYSSDTPDFWRRPGEPHPSHSGRFSGKPGYFDHIKESSRNLLKKTGLHPKDFNYAIFHSPNAKFPIQVGKELGFTEKQIDTSLIVRNIGNPYTASSLLGLIAVLEEAKENQFIFMASYGSGAGSDAFIFKTTKKIKSPGNKLNKTIEKKQYIDYLTYLKQLNHL